MKKHIGKKALILSASVLALSIVAYTPPAEAGSRYCRYSAPRCVDSNGNDVSITACGDARSGAGYRPPYGRWRCSSRWGCPRRRRVICTHFYQKGEISEDAYFGDSYFTLKYLPKAMVRGYHYWAIPYVKHMRENPNGLAEKIMRPIALHRANELSYKLGIRSKPDYLGKIVRLTLEPISLLIGLFVTDQDYNALYTPKAQSMLNKKFELYMLQKQANEVIDSYNKYTKTHAI